MKLKLISANGFDKNLKATIHKTGKLGFTIESAEKMKFGHNKFMGIMMNEEDDTDKNLYVLLSVEAVPGYFSINKAGKYHYINAKPLFDNLKMDYANSSISYDITEETIDDQTIFKFTLKHKSKKAAEAA